MPPLEITLDAAINSPNEPGFFHRYDSLAIIRSLNPIGDGVSNQALWYDRASFTLMLKPEQVSGSFLNSLAQLAYIIRFTAFTVNPANSARVFEANLAQNANNPFIHHTPISPLSPVAWTHSPEQAPGLTAIDNVSNDSGSVSGFPGSFPGVSASDAKVICWTHDPLPWNMPLYLRWWVSPDQAGHLLFYDFYIGQFCVRCGPTVVEIFKDTSAAKNRSAWASVARLQLFNAGALSSTGAFGGAVSSGVSEHQGHLRGLLWLPYRRNYVYLESSAGHHGVFKANALTGGNGLAGGQADWGIVESRNLVVAGLTPGPGFFQIQKVKFADGPGVFNLEPFALDYRPAAAPAANWLVDDRDIPQGSTLTHTTPTTPVPYTFTVNDIDHCTDTATLPVVSDQSRVYGAVYTLTPGTDPTSGGLLKTYTPFLYGVEARVPNQNINWPHASLSFSDVSIASPSARIKRAEIVADLGSPGRFSAEVEDLGLSLAGYYFRSDFPLQFSDSNGMPGNPAAWTTLWLGIAEPVETHELRLDSAAPRELRLSGIDYWKWLNEAPMRDNRDWTGFGHITTLQSVLKQAGISVAGWDGPAPGSVSQKSVNGQIVDVFQIDALGYDTPLGGPPTDDPTVAMEFGDAVKSQPVRSAWRPLAQPPDSYGSFSKRIAELWSGWDFGFHPDGTAYYHRWDYYTASEALFRADQTHGDPHYFRGSVQYEPLYPDANSVAVVASTFGGSLITSSLWVDFASIYNPNAVNFIGKEKGLFLALPGVLSCDALNYCARSIFERARRRRLRVHFHGTYLPALKIGHCFTLEGITGVWRLQSVSATYQTKGWDTARYIGEKVELGHN